MVFISLPEHFPMGFSSLLHDGILKTELGYKRKARQSGGKLTMESQGKRNAHGSAKV